MRSLPAPRRHALAAVLLVAGFVVVVGVKLTRKTDGAIPGRVAGALPNLVCAAVVPVAVFLGPRVVTARDYLTLDAFVLAGLCAYEVAQIWMPRRTFSWDDIWASVAGAVVAAVLGFALFLRPSR